MGTRLSTADTQDPTPSTLETTTPRPRIAVFALIDISLIQYYRSIRSVHPNDRSGSFPQLRNYKGENNIALALRIPASLPQSNQVGEAIATKEQADRADKRVALENETDSKYVLKHLTTSLQLMEDSGYIGIPNKEIIRAMVASFRGRKQKTILKWVNGHSGHPGNKMADLLANEGARKDTGEIINLEVPPTLRVTGAALCTISQSRAYKAFRERSIQKLPFRKNTQDNVQLATSEAKAIFGIKPTEIKLWKSLRHRDVDRNTRYLLWMTMHDVYRVGAKRLHFAPQYHERAYCKHCGNCVESMEHILTACSSPGQNEIWQLAKSVLERRGIPWHPPTLATVLTCAIPEFKNPAGNRDSGRERFYRIVMSSSAQVIWNARCERVIQKENASLPPEKIKTMWLSNVNKRLELDCRMTHKRFGKKALNKDLVMRTWSGSILNEHQLPEDWMEVGGVLVGITL
ncbi:hypothetical protein EDD85DRAFT_774610 [Armillaria nabsnona]|nr:hypothetical protein EDD85DRAFT_774610 [Armillaria nabsnona]